MRGSKDNIARQYMSARIDGAIAQARAFQQHPNPWTRGRLREITLQELLKPMLPPTWGIGTGFVVDATGQTTQRDLADDDMSGQEDIIIYAREQLPEFWKLQEQLLVPVESCLGVIEVKSKLTRGDLAATLNHADKVASLKSSTRKREQSSVRDLWRAMEALYEQLPSWEEHVASQPPDNFSRFRPHYALFAYDTTLQKDRTPHGEHKRLKSVVKKRGSLHHLSALCVVETGSLFFDRDTREAAPASFDEHGHDHVLCFLSWFVAYLCLVETIRKEQLLVPTFLAYFGLDTGESIQP